MPWVRAALGGRPPRRGSRGAGQQDEPDEAGASDEASQVIWGGQRTMGTLVPRGEAMLTRAICAAAGVFLLSPQAGNATPKDATAVIRHLEDELTIAFNKYDAVALDRLWADDLVFVFPNGALAGKAERLAGLKEVPAEIPISAHESVDTKSLVDVAVAVVLSK